MATPTLVKCQRCKEVVELVEEDHGGYEEVWGARVWVAAITDVTECCYSEDYEEVNDEDV